MKQLICIDASTCVINIQMMHVLKPYSMEGISKFRDCRGTGRYVNTKIRGKINLSKSKHI